MGIKLKFKRLTDTAKMPKYAHDGDSGMDICADEDVQILPHSYAKISTGIAAVMPDGYEIQVRPRSGMQCIKGIVGAWGTVDTQYRGEIGVALYNHTDETYVVHRGDRIAQLVILPYLTAEFEEAGELSATERGAGGFGSTGK